MRTESFDWNESCIIDREDSNSSIFASFCFIDLREASYEADVCSNCCWRECTLCSREATLDGGEVGNIV